MKYLYTLEEAKKWKKRASLMQLLSLGLIGAALLICVILCSRVNTANAQAMLITVMILSTLSGWSAILIWYFSYSPARAQAIHIAGIITGEKTMAEGVLSLHKESFRIPKSITVRKATLLTTEGPVSLSVSTAFARQLPTGVSLRVETVRRFITAYEVIA